MYHPHPSSETSDGVADAAKAFLALRPEHVVARAADGSVALSTLAQLVQCARPVDDAELRAAALTVVRLWRARLIETRGRDAGRALTRLAQLAGSGPKR